MCEYCSVEEGNCKELITGRAFTNKNEDYAMTGLFIENDSLPQHRWSLSISSWIFDANVINDSIEIKYCPFCGQKLI